MSNSSQNVGSFDDFLHFLIFFGYIGKGVRHIMHIMLIKLTRQKEGGWANADVGSLQSTDSEKIGITSKIPSFYQKHQKWLFFEVFVDFFSKRPF